LAFAVSRSTAASAAGTNHIRPPGNRSGFRGWLSGFRPLQVSRALAKAAVASAAIAVLLPSRVTRWFPLMHDNHRSVSGHSSWLGGLSEHKCAAADTMGAGLQGWKARTQLAALPFWGSVQARSQTCSSKLQQRARDLAITDALIHGWPGTNGAQRGALRHFATKGLGALSALGSTTN
jgi:hypothetical protein